MKGPALQLKVSRPQTAVYLKQVLWCLLLTCWALATLEISHSTSSQTSPRDDAEHAVAPNPSTFGPQKLDQRLLTNEKASLPIWGDESGIDFAAIEAYFNYSLQPENKGAKHNILYPPKLYPPEFKSPNVIYNFGRRDARAPEVVVDGSTRKPVRRWLQNARYKPLETLLVDSLEYLMNTTHVNPKWKRLEHLLTKTTPGIPMIVNLDDHRHCSEGNLVHEGTLYNLPVWTLAAANPHQEYCHHSFPLPTFSTMELVKEIEQPNRDGPMNFEVQDAKYPWASKRPTLVWRGTSSGVAPLDYRTFKYNNNDTLVAMDVRTTEEEEEHRRRIQKTIISQIDPLNSATHPIRLQMVHRAMNQSAARRNNLSMPLLDISYNPGIHQHYKDHFPHLQEKPYIKPTENFQNYKAVLDVDGNSWSERFARLLCMNSVVVKVEPEFVDYFFTDVKPWVHYVPVKQDSSDLWEIAQYVMDHDQEM